jgi:deazaflavin-dependent oxidoreductase (nitroreductase family)
VRLLVTSRPVAQLSARLLPGLDRVTARVSRGRLVFSAWVTGLPVLLLTAKGARTGEPRTARVPGIPDGDGFVIVAANFGQCANPRLVPQPPGAAQVSAVAGDAEGTYYARELSGAERERGFRQALFLNPGWRRFQQRAGERVIPVVRLEVSIVPDRGGWPQSSRRRAITSTIGNSCGVRSWMGGRVGTTS